MPGLIYKYLSPDAVEAVFSDPGCVRLKCSYPADFQDPYELSLTVDFADRPETLAFYQEVVGELEQIPTTCFSRSPAVIPMWAHYARGLQGVVVELDERLVQDAFPKSRFGDVEYRDVPDDDLRGMLKRAQVIGKPRYAYFLRNGAFREAYFTKASCWSYELERRMIVAEAEVRRQLHLMLVDIPITCVTSLIVGPSASAETSAAVQQCAVRAGIRYLGMRVGRSARTPYFVDTVGAPHEFDGERICPSARHCERCGEPSRGLGLCSWCAMEDVHRKQAAANNPYRALAEVGILESYVQGMDAIGRRIAGGDA